MSRNIFRVLIVEPSPTVAAGLQSQIDKAAGFTVVECLSDAAILSDCRLDAIAPDIILLNPSVVDYAKQNALRVAIPSLTRYRTIGIIYNSFLNDVLAQFDVTIGLGDSYSSIMKKLREVASFDNSPRQERDELSQRECDILVAVARGETNKEIADRFNLSVYTVITHRKNITRKLGIRTISGLTVYAIMNHLLDVTDFVSR